MEGQTKEVVGEDGERQVVPRFTREAIENEFRYFGSNLGDICLARKGLRGTAARMGPTYRRRQSEGLMGGQRRPYHRRGEYVAFESSSTSTSTGPEQPLAAAPSLPGPSGLQELPPTPLSRRSLFPPQVVEGDYDPGLPSPPMAFPVSL